MEKLNEWQKKLTQYRDLVKHFHDLTENQQEYLDNADVEGFISFTTDKERLMEQMDKTKEEIFQLKDDIGTRIPEPYLTQARKLQDEIKVIFEDAMEKSAVQEDKLKKMKDSVRQDLDTIKVHKQASGKYKGENNKPKDEGVFFDKKS